MFYITRSTYVKHHLIQSTWSNIEPIVSANAYSAENIATLVYLPRHLALKERELWTYYIIY